MTISQSPINRNLPFGVHHEQRTRSRSVVAQVNTRIAERVTHSTQVSQFILNPQQVMIQQFPIQLPTSNIQGPTNQQLYTLTNQQHTNFTKSRGKMF
jgi:hypothetical protein